MSLRNVCYKCYYINKYFHIKQDTSIIVVTFTQLIPSVLRHHLVCDWMLTRSALQFYQLTRWAISINIRYNRLWTIVSLQKICLTNVYFIYLSRYTCILYWYYKILYITYTLDILCNTYSLSWSRGKSPFSNSLGFIGNSQLSKSLALSCTPLNKNAPSTQTPIKNSNSLALNRKRFRKLCLVSLDSCMLPVSRVQTLYSRGALSIKNYKHPREKHITINVP